jgi:nucleoside-diphosphate-sugar epimerase
MPRAMLTGITGFIGGFLAERLLQEGWTVDALVRPTSDVKSLSCADAITLHQLDEEMDLGPAIAAAQPDIVFHLASLYLPDHRSDQVKDLVRSNILFPAMLAEAMSAAGIKHLVNTGTAWQHFESRAYLPVNLYAATKQAAEDLLAYYADARQCSVITLKLFDTYGRGDKRRKLIQILIEAALSEEALAMSPGEQIVDLTHVEDVVDGFIIAAHRLLASSTPLRETFFLSGERHSVKGLADLVGNILGRIVEPQFGGRPYRAREVMHPLEAGPDDMLPGWSRRILLTDYIAGHREA